MTIKTMDGIAVDGAGYVGNRFFQVTNSLTRSRWRRANDAVLPLVGTFADYGALVDAVDSLNRAPSWAWQDGAEKSMIMLRRFLMGGDVGCCGVEREVVIDHYKLNVDTGAMSDGGTEAVIQPCGHPFPGDGQVICKTCREGYSVNGNRPTARGLAQIAAIKAWEALKP